MKLVKLFSLTLLTTVIHSTVFASSETGCFDGMRSWLNCNYEGISLIHPMNDTRLNLQLLAGAYIIKDELNSDEREDYGESSPCFSNNEKSVELFSKAVETEKFAADLKVKLIELRTQLNTGCKKPLLTSSEIEEKCNEIGKQDPEAQPFCQYLLGASFLYDSVFGTALNKFENLVTAKNPWLSETAKYLTGRVALIDSQTHWNGFMSWSQQIDKELLATAYASFQSYLSQYPNGQYVESTKGLLGRLFWLKGDTNEALKIVEEGIYYAAEKRSANLLNFRIVDSEIMEIFNISGPCPSSPLMGAVCTLKKLRIFGSNISKEGLDLQQESVNSFKVDSTKFPGLMEIIRAYAALNNNTPEEVLKIVASVPANSPELILDTAQRLKGLALEQQKKYEEAFTIWNALYDKSDIRDAVRAEFINSFILRDKLEDLLVKEKREVFVDEAKYEENPVLAQYASETLLKKLSKVEAAGKETHEGAINILFQKYLLLRSFDKFERQYNESSAAIKNKYSDLASAVKSFKNNPKDGSTILTLLDALEAHYFLEERKVDPAIDLPQKKVWSVAGQVPYDFYLEALAIVQKHPTVSNSENEPKILSKLINCFTDGGKKYDCLPPEDVPVSLRKKWFQRLKSKYKDTTWANDQRYYY